MLSRRSILRGGAGVALATTAAGITARAAYSATTTEWEKLRPMLQGDVVLPTDTGYTYAKQVILGEFDSLNPEGIVYCETPADVATAIKFARNNGIATRIRSGGHNLAGWSTTKGMILDVGRINHATVGTSTVKVGPGAQGVDVLTKLKPLGKQVISGTCPTVCPGGYLSGGGIGLQTRKFGIGSDRLVSAKLVLSDGSQVRASSSENADLFWALRGGGGNNFGVVTEFEVRPINAPTMVFYNTLWPYDKALEVINAWQEWLYFGSDNLGSTLSVFLADGASGNVPMVQITGGYLGPQAELETALNELAAEAGATPTLRTVQDLPYADAMKHVYGCEQLTAEQCHRTGSNPAAQLQRVPFMRELTRLLDRPTGRKGVADLLAAFEADRRPGQARNLYFMALGGVSKRPFRTETAYVHRDAEFFVAMASMAFKEPTAEEAAAAMVWPTRAFSIIDPLSSGETYLNFPNGERDDWRRAYYAENYDRLVAVKRRYDAPNFFNHPQSIGS